MLGLEFICKTFQVEYKSIADELGISKVGVSEWIKGKRKIPQKRLEQLSRFFSLPEYLFQKEDLTEEEKIQIQLQSLKLKAKQLGYEIELKKID
jgi:transcriptional regulator with XRE-family HTH domain